ncbi:hypothetical protein LRP49_00865 [Enterovibrio sp. ZSDZ35]|uniref:Uncharacterized protein n=2 Tax=Enterovibrio qingdaonensis TaxID=2899818 RepID=A0ABT5QGA8_9GAMM|nr:hypothetical protein [Enterovibrio sp. ZSDZ35]MDD1779733.1 hypothetical protein [Enterovibrio sp. ZSDZ35]
MGKALSRRIVHSFDNLNILTNFSQLEEASSYKQPIYCIESDNHQVFVLAHRMISASSACRKGLVRDIKHVLEEVSIDRTKDARLIIVADHWVDRSSASKSIPSWWLGHQPIHIDEYISQGIRLVLAEQDLATDIESECSLEKGLHRLYNPLHRQRDGLPLYKYLLLTATYPI